MDDALCADYTTTPLLRAAHIKQNFVEYIAKGYLVCTAISVVFEINIPVISNLNYVAKEVCAKLFETGTKALGM